VAGKRCRSASIASAIVHADALVAITHVTGHMNAGLGATIKNLAMGCASRAGKLAMHSASRPAFHSAKCTACGACLRSCPVEAITVDKFAVVDDGKCISCGECYTVCRFKAISFSWASASEAMQEKLADYTAAVMAEKKGKSAFLSFIIGVTKDCDCQRGRKPVEVEDIGIVAGRDAVAVDQAAMDLVNERAGRDLFRKLWPHIDATLQLRAAEALGVGSRKYELVRAD